MAPHDPHALTLLPTETAFAKAREDEPAPAPPSFLQVAEDERRDRRRLRIAIAVAAVLHLGLLAVHLPERRPVAVPAAEAKAYVVQQVRFRPPPTAPERQPEQHEKRRKIPIPDPTPLEPEPIREQALDLPEVDLDLPVGDLVFDIPPGPPGPTGSAGEPLRVGGEVQAPVKIHAPRPTYTEEARQARIQGVVLLQAVIDEDGRVADVQVLKGLPMGLDKVAVATVEGWIFEPATKNGLPVPVFYNVTVSFTLQ